MIRKKNINNNQKMNYQNFLQKDRVPSSKINDYLPRTILDEIQIKTPKTSQSFK